MKQLLLFACLLFTATGLMAQKTIVYVNGTATGANDGTTWADAYSELDSAFVNSPVGASIWIAAGTYVTPAARGFQVTREYEILGGFAGTESTPDAADPTANVTILSGDVMGNDVAGTYDSLGYLDNNRVLLVQDTVAEGSFVTIIDGLTFANGGIATDGNTFNFAGGGLLVNGEVNISRCVFMNNRATFGSAMTLFGASSAGSTMDEITAMSNFAGGGHNFYIDGADGLMVTNSTFTGLGKTSGNRDEMFRIIDANNATVSNCTFSNIDGRAIRGAGIQFNNSDGILVTDCSFDQIGTTRGAIYVNGIPDRPDADPSNDIVVTNCTITNVTAEDRCALGGGGGGGGQNWLVSNTTFMNNDVNTATGSTSGFYTFGSGAEETTHAVTFNDCTFEENTAMDIATAIYILEFDGSKVDLTINGGRFENNIATPTEGFASFGGAILIRGIDATTAAANKVTTNGVEFKDNVATVGSAIANLGGPYEYDFNNTRFISNGLSDDANQGGAISLYHVDGNVGMDLDSCVFEENFVDFSPGAVAGGGAIYAFGPSSGTTPITIKNTSFLRNAADGTAPETTSSGAGIHIRGGISLTIEDSEFLSNNSFGDGGAITINRFAASRDTTDTGIDVTFPDSDASIERTLFIGNISSTQGGAIATQRNLVDLTNNIFLNNRISNGGGSGGAVIFNGNAPSYNTTQTKWDSIGSLQLSAEIVHNTFFGNLDGGSMTSVGNQIALFQGAETALNEVNSMTYSVLNNIFMNEEADLEGIMQVEVEPYNAEGSGAAGQFDAIGKINFNSLGGNFYNGENSTAIPVASNDIFSTEFDVEDDLVLLFADLFGDDEDVIDVALNVGDDNGASNPLINGGVQDALVPAIDILGNTRDANPDIGAVEADLETVGVQTIEESGLEMSFFPNPTIDVLTIQNNDANIGKFYVTVADQSGRMLSANVFNGVNSRIDLSEVPAGIYNLIILVEGKLYSKQIVKQ